MFKRKISKNIRGQLQKNAEFPQSFKMRHAQIVKLQLSHAAF